MILQADTISGSRAGVSRLQPSQFQRLSDVSPYQRARLELALLSPTIVAPAIRLYAEPQLKTSGLRLLTSATSSFWREIPSF